MEKKLIPLSECTINNIIAQDVINSNGIKLISKFSQLNSYVREKLESLNIKQVWVYESIDGVDNESNEILCGKVETNYEINVFRLKNILNDLVSGKGLDYAQFEDVTDSIFTDFDHNFPIIKCLSKIKSFDDYTYKHSLNVSFYAMLIGKWLKLSTSDIKNLIQAGLLHDIGKIKVPSKILNKPGTLTDDEFVEIKKHVNYGFDIVKEYDYFNKNILDAIHQHHERVDGSGYPDGLKGSELSTFAKIISVADVYDAMTSDRVYRRKDTPFNAFKMFTSSGLSGFDVEVLYTFLQNVAFYYTGSKVKLNTGDIGEIVFIPPHDIVNPIIDVKSNYINLHDKNDVDVIEIF